MIKEIHSLFYLNHKEQDQNMRHVFFAVNPINLLILPNSLIMLQMKYIYIIVLCICSNLTGSIISNGITVYKNHEYLFLMSFYATFYCTMFFI